MNQLRVEAAEASYCYGARKALSAASFQVEPGRIFVLVGPNGSGKTTLLKMLAGFMRPSEGQIRVCGYDPYRDRVRVMKRASFSFAPPGFYDSLTAWQHMKSLCSLGRGPGSGTDDQDLRRALEWVGLTDRAHDRVSDFSFGMRQRLSLALALVPTPELLVLDEPADGLDPLAILELRTLLLDLRDRHGLSIILSSHLISQLDDFADELLILREGETLFQGAPAALTDGSRRLRLVVERDVARARTVLTEQGLSVNAVGDDWLTLPDGAANLNEVRGILEGEGLALTEFSRQKPNLEDALLTLLRKQEAAVES